MTPLTRLEKIIHIEMVRGERAIKTKRLKTGSTLLEINAKLYMKNAWTDIMTSSWGVIIFKCRAQIAVLPTQEGVIIFFLIAANLTSDWLQLLWPLIAALIASDRNYWNHCCQLLNLSLFPQFFKLIIK